jgi:hypothetical protein
MTSTAATSHHTQFLEDSEILAKKRFAVQIFFANETQQSLTERLQHFVEAFQVRLRRLKHFLINRHH